MLIHFHQFLDKLTSTPARKSKIIVISSIISVVFNLAVWALIYFKFYPLVSNLPEDQAFIPLHYNIYLGVDLFGRWHRIFLLPGIGLFIFLLNSILALYIYSKNELASYFLSIVSSLIQIILLVATIMVILINI